MKRECKLKETELKHAVVFGGLVHDIDEGSSLRPEGLCGPELISHELVLHSVIYLIQPVCTSPSTRRTQTEERQILLKRIPETYVNSSSTANCLLVFGFLNSMYSQVPEEIIISEEPIRNCRKRAKNSVNGGRYCLSQKGDIVSKKIIE